MKIGFVAEPYEEHNASGMGFVVSELLKNMLTQGTSHEFVIYSTSPIDRNFIPGTYRTVRLPRGFIRKIFWFFWMPREIDALLFVAPLLPLLIPRSVRPIVICQELASQKIRPNGFTETLFAFIRDRVLMPLCIRRAKVIIAASDATRRDLQKFYGVPEQKLKVIYDGYQDLSRYAADAPTIDKALTPFFFFAGKVKYRKNVHGIVSAFIDFKKRTKVSVQLVIAGDYGGEYYEEIMKTLHEAEMEREVHFIGYTSGSKLYAYYKDALAVVFPSINEGFGMPIIEAMSVGTPVITSNISSMAEAAGNAALLVDPFDVSDISRAMEHIFYDTGLRAKLIEKGYVQAKKFSWEKTAKEYMYV